MTDKRHRRKPMVQSDMYLENFTQIKIYQKKQIFLNISSSRSENTLSVAMRSGVTPVPIPNTMVKTWAADDTMLETAWESRWLPD